MAMTKAEAGALGRQARREKEALKREKNKKVVYDLLDGRRGEYVTAKEVGERIGLGPKTAAHFMKAVFLPAYIDCSSKRGFGYMLHRTTDKIEEKPVLSEKKKDQMESLQFAMQEAAEHKRNERMKQVYDILDANRGKYISAGDLACKAGAPSAMSIRNFMQRYFIVKYPETVSSHSGYMLPEKADDQTPMKNPEGYSDRTAGKAIANMGKALAGEVWAYTYNNGLGTKFVLIVSATATTSIVLELMDPSAKSQMKYPIEIRTSGREYVVDAAMPCWKPNKYLTNKVSELTPTQMNFVKRGLAGALDIRTEVRIVEKPVEKFKFIEKPVEKIVEKVVEVPVEKIVDKDDTEIAVLRAEHAIYKSIVDRLLGKVTVDAV